MAIVANKRKRKHKQLENGTEKDEVLSIMPPKKLIKSKDIKESFDNSSIISINNSCDKQENHNGEMDVPNRIEANNVETDGEREDEEGEQEGEIKQGNSNGLEMPVVTKLSSNGKSMKFSNNFKMLNFRAKLRGNDFITELKHFLYLAEQRPTVIVKYIKKRGKPLELVEALERIDQTNVEHCSYICEALQLVVMEIVANYNEHFDSAVYGCRYLLKAYAQTIDSLLNSKESKHRKIALKLLTALVCVDAQLGRHILATFNVFSNVKSIQKLLTYSLMELKQEIDKTEDGNVVIQKQQHRDGGTVRKCFIHFVLSYLMDGNVLLIRNILDYNTLIKSVIDGLVFDDALTVCMVLNALKKFVVENTDISKTKKIHVFDLNCCKALIKLYDWCGPKVNWLKVYNGTAKSNANKSDKFVGLLGETITNGNDSIVASDLCNNDSKETEIVSKMVHEFLLIILTSRKNGIAFDTIKYFGQKHNTIQGQVIGSITKPWSSPLKMELVCKILEACPDLYRHTVRHYAGMLNPVRCGQKFYVNVADFLRQIINSCHPTCLKDAIETKITLTDLSYWIKDICFPLESLVHIKGSKLLHHRDFHIRLITNRLLLAMFQQYSNYVKLLRQQQQQQVRQQNHQSKGATNDIRKFKFEILNHLLSNFPTVETILTSLNLSMEYKNNEDVDIFAHMDVALDLLLLICYESLTFVNKTTVILDYLELLRPIYANENSHNIRLEIKAIKTILILSPKVLEPSREQFADILESFIKAFVYGEPDVRKEAGNLLYCIFKNTGIFDCGELEINLWLESLHFFSDNPVTIDAISQVFSEVLKVTKAPVEMPVTDVETITNMKKLHKLFERIENGLSVVHDGSSNDAELLTISKLMPLIYKGVEIVKPLADYLECVCLLMFHHYHKLEYVLKLHEMKFPHFLSYMTSWLDVTHVMKSEENLKKLEKFKMNIPKWLDINNYLFDNANNEMNTIERYFRNEKAKGTKENKNLEMDTTAIMPSKQLLMIYIQLLVFQVVHLKQKRQLMCWQAEKAAKFINECLICISEQSSRNGMTHLKSYPNNFGISKCHEEEIVAETLYESSLEILLKYIFSTNLQEVNYQELLIGTNNAIDYPESQTSLAFLKFVKLLIQSCNKLDINFVNFELLSITYKTKLVKIITISMGNVDEMKKYKKFSTVLKQFLEVLNVLQLNDKFCLEILNHLSDHLTYKDYFMENDNHTNGLKEYSFYYHLLAFCLERIASTQTAVKCDSFIKKFQKLYQQFYKKFQPQDVNIENLEEAFFQFLKINHHYVEKMTKLFFECFLLPDRKLFKSSIKLCCFIYKHSNQDNNELNEAVLNYLNTDNMERKELLYPLLDVVFEKNLHDAKGSMTNDIFKKLYEKFKNGFLRLVEKPQKSAQIYKESVKAAIKLVELCMPLTECKDFCMKQLKFDCVELGQIKLIQCIYMRAFHGCETNDSKKILHIFNNYILLTCNMFLLDIKTQKLCIEKCEMMAFFVQKWFNKLDSIINSAEKLNFTKDFTNIIQSNQWLPFCKAIIKKGMEETINEDSMDSKALGKLHGLLLKLLAYLIDHLYTDYDNLDCGENISRKVKHDELGQLFELIFHHSKFYGIVFQQQQQQYHNEYCEIEQKQQLMYLLYVLAKKCPNALKQEQIPIILGAYQAQLSISDRYCLALLNFYENYGKSLEKYKPFLWGESAISFYNLNTQITNNISVKTTNLNCTEIAINQIMLLVDKQICEYTLENYPVWRKLQTLDQMPEIEFEDPVKAALRFGNNDLERKIEMGIGELREDAELRLCPKRCGIYEKCYDPAFFIPLMSMIFAANSYCHPARPLQNGLLSISIAALSSQDKQMRLAAGCTQLRYREHFEQSHFFEKPLWVQMYDNIQAGLDDLRQNAMKLKGKNNIPRIPLISSLFIAKTFNLTTEPTYLLYKQLTLHMRLKNVFDFHTIPDFNVLFYSSEVEHLEYRRFIIQLICNSLKCSVDLFQLISTNTFKVLMACYSSSNNVSTLDINLLILSIFSTCVKIPASVKLMIENVGILSWLNCLINNIEFYQFDIIDGVIIILNNLWYSLNATKTEFHNFSYLQKQLHQLVIKILPKLSARIKVANFCKLMNILNKTTDVTGTITATAMTVYDKNNIEYELVSKEQMKHLLTCAEKHFGTILIKPLFNIYAMGGTGCSSVEDYCHQLYNASKLNVKYILGLNSLRSYLIKWWPIHQRRLL